MKRLFLILSAVICLLTLSGCEKKVNTVFALDGGASVTRAKESTDILLQKGMRIKSEDVFHVEPASSVWLRLCNGKTALLCENSEIRFTSVKKADSLYLEKGTAFARLEKPLKAAECFEILVGNTILRSRGAVFSVELVGDKSAILNIYQGEVEVIDQNGHTLNTFSKGMSINFEPFASIIKSQTDIDFANLPYQIYEAVKDYAEEAAMNAELQSSQSAEFIQTVESESDIATEGVISPDAILQDNKATPGTVQGDSTVATTGTTAIDEAALAKMPRASFKYTWSGTSYKPSADISWKTTKTSYVLWQGFDEKGKPLETKGRIEAQDNGFNNTHVTFDITSNTGLFPKGSVVRLTPYELEETGKEKALQPIDMILPYFVVTAYKNKAEKIATIETNIGFYFKHSYESLQQINVNENVGIEGSLLPLDGEKVPIKIKVFANPNLNSLSTPAQAVVLSKSSEARPR